MIDVCFLVEGAYPYIAGGVSSWIQQLLTQLPQYAFGITTISTHPDSDRIAKYPFPHNVTHFKEVYINVPENRRAPHAVKHTAANWRPFIALHQAIMHDQPFDPAEFAALVRPGGFGGLTAKDVLFAEQSWPTLEYLYGAFASEQSFVDFFWTFRFTYLPLFALLESPILPASVYHAVSTGFSGFLGALAKIRQGGKLVLTEHGLYTREREIELMQADWIYIPDMPELDLKPRLGFFQKWWLHFFRFIERLTYAFADTIISIAAVNQAYQERNGADPAKMRLIPNGVDVQRFTQLPTKFTSAVQDFVVGFVGRVVPIKDVKTFIRAIHLAHRRIPQLKAAIVGPTDEDPAYYAECVELARMLGLADALTFTGRMDVADFYPTCDVVALTSLSEGQPLVILEANAAGVPIVASDVGSCQELLEGISPEDRALGASGLITPVVSPSATADALIALWRNTPLRQAMGHAGRQRVQQFYRQETLIAAYDDLYHALLPARVAHAAGGL